MGKKVKKQASKLASKAYGPANAATGYSGPMLPPSATKADDMMTTRIVQRAIILSAATGSIAAQYNNQPNSSYTDWTNFSGAYAEFRVLAQRVRWEPYYVNVLPSGTSLATGPAVLSVNRNAGIGAPVNAALAFGLTESKIANISQRFLIDVRASTADEMLFGVTNGPSATWIVNFNCDGVNVVPTAYGYLFSELLIQFRNRV
jgi:hypothetical protein